MKIPLDQYMAFQVKVKPFESLKAMQRSEMKKKQTPQLYCSSSAFEMILYGRERERKESMVEEIGFFVVVSFQISLLFDGRGIAKHRETLESE